MRKNDIIANFIKFYLHLLRNQNGDGGGGGLLTFLRCLGKRMLNGVN